MRGLCAVAMVGMLAGVATNAMADNVTVDFTGTGYGKNVSITLSGGLKFADNSTSRNVFAGILNHTINGNPTKTFCTELTQWAHDSNNYSFMNLPEAPKPGSGMGAAKADAIYALFNAVGGADGVSTGSTSTRNKQAAAFQALIWEIVYDYNGSSSSSVNLGSGNVRITGIDSSIFNSYKALAFSSSRDTTASVRVISHDNWQDQIVPIPLPSAAMMAMASMGVVAIRRRR